MLEENPSEVVPLIKTDYFKKENVKRFHNWHKNPEIWKNIYNWIPETKQLYFTGGEPTLIKKNWELIDYLKQKGYSKNIHLMFNINCTQVPDKLLETFHTFAKVCINFSVDGYKEVGEYIRSPSKWEEVESNIIKLLKHRKETTYFYFSPVVQVYNILDLPRLLRWIDELQTSYGTIGNSMNIVY